MYSSTFKSTSPHAWPETQQTISYLFHNCYTVFGRAITVHVNINIVAVSITIYLLPATLKSSHSFIHPLIDQSPQNDVTSLTTYMQCVLYRKLYIRLTLTLHKL